MLLNVIKLVLKVVRSIEASQGREHLTVVFLAITTPTTQLLQRRAANNRAADGLNPRLKVLTDPPLQGITEVKGQSS